jgi:hypothetical protein
LVDPVRFEPPVDRLNTRVGRPAFGSLAMGVDHYQRHRIQGDASVLMGLGRTDSESSTFFLALHRPLDMKHHAVPVDIRPAQTRGAPLVDIPSGQPA